MCVILLYVCVWKYIICIPIADLPFQGASLCSPRACVKCACAHLSSAKNLAFVVVAASTREPQRLQFVIWRRRTCLPLFSVNCFRFLSPSRALASERLIGFHCRPSSLDDHLVISLLSHLRRPSHTSLPVCVVARTRAVTFRQEFRQRQLCQFWRGAHKHTRECQNLANCWSFPIARALASISP